MRRLRHMQTLCFTAWFTFNQCINTKGHIASRGASFQGCVREGNSGKVRMPHDRQHGRTVWVCPESQQKQLLLLLSYVYVRMCVREITVAAALMLPWGSG